MFFFQGKNLTFADPKIIRYNADLIKKANPDNYR